MLTVNWLFVIWGSRKFLPLRFYRVVFTIPPWNWLSASAIGKPQNCSPPQNNSIPLVSDLRDSSDWRGIQNDYLRERKFRRSSNFLRQWKSACVSLRNFCSILRKETTLRGASALTDLITQHFFLWKNLHILRTPNFQKNTLVGQVWLFRSFPNNFEGSYKFVKEHTSVFWWWFTRKFLLRVLW